MPELPEVETIVRGLRLALPGRGIVNVRLGKTDFIDDPVALAESLPGKSIARIERIGKFIDVQLDSTGDPSSRLHLIVHLGMTGRLVVREPEHPSSRHTHVFFDLDDGRELRYADSRRFGRMFVLPESGLQAFHDGLGAEPLEISADEFRRSLTGRHARIKALLLDQRFLRGIGNIYADESLWEAGIHPTRIAAQLDAPKVKSLWQAIRRVLREAILFRGSSVSDYVDAKGKRGSYQQHHHVYQRKGLPCPRCRASIQRTIVAGRSSHFCPRCQRLPRVPRKGAKRRGNATPRQSKRAK